MMTKQTEALKMAIEALAMDNDCECGRSDEIVSALVNALEACKEALEQPSVAELNNEYLRDTHVEGLSEVDVDRIYCEVQDNCVKDFPSELYAAWFKATKETT